MKRILKYNLLVLIALSLLMPGCNKTIDRSFLNDYIDGDIDSLSFDETKQQLLALHLQLEMVAAFSGLGNKSQPTDYAEEDERETEQFTLPKELSEVDFASGITFGQSADYPSAALEIKSEVKTGVGERVTYYIDQIYYKDGTVDTINYSISSSHQTQFKGIDSVTITARYRVVTGYDTVVLNKDKREVAYENGSIKIEVLDNNHVQYYLSDSISGRFITALAQTKSGKIVNTRSYSSGSIPPDKEQQFLEKALKRLKKITTKIAADEYKTKEDLLKDVDKLSAGMEAGKKYYRSEYYYGNVDELIIYMRTERESKDYVMTFPVTAHISDYNMVEDDNKLVGIVSSDGVEVVKPQYRDLSQINDYYYNAKDYYNDIVLLLNKTENKLDTLPYRPASINKLTDQCVSYSHLGKIGVLDKDGKVVIPNKYEKIIATSAQPYIIIADTETGFELYTADGQTKLFSGAGYLLNKDVEGWNRAPFEGGNWALCYENNEPAYFMSPDGKKTLNVSQYDYVGLFSEGLAAVSKNRKYGFIREDGSVAIPFIYTSADYFSYGVTKVTQEPMERGRGYSIVALINTKGEFVVPFEEYGSTSVSTNFGKRVYHINGRNYDHKGQLMQE